MEPFRIRRRDVWAVGRRGWRGRLRSSGVLVPLAIGLAMLTGGALWYWEAQAFARRSVVTEAVVVKVEPPYRLEQEDGPPIVVHSGMVRYRVAGRAVTARLTLASCRPGPCASRAALGDRLTVAYDPGAVGRARRAPPGGLSGAPEPAMLLLAGIGVLFVAAAAYSLLSFTEA
ncbi:DUF3592 domain-containing protein [Spirillospora sp. NPDC029432]|uniref:DUF3592 domain-containing protein n=1 Tax=Spirillospora sp. NPDC029432 TaxID=3154599 RepID=UPI0034541F88